MMTLTQNVPWIHAAVCWLSKLCDCALKCFVFVCRGTKKPFCRFCKNPSSTNGYISKNENYISCVVSHPKDDNLLRHIMHWALLMLLHDSFTAITQCWLLGENGHASSGWCNKISVSVSVSVSSPACTTLGVWRCVIKILLSLTVCFSRQGDSICQTT